jgi:hypothetical protein
LRILPPLRFVSLRDVLGGRVSGVFGRSHVQTFSEPVEHVSADRTEERGRKKDFVP